MEFAGFPSKHGCFEKILNETLHLLHMILIKIAEVLI
jgi:hypothetical protein